MRLPVLRIAATTLLLTLAVPIAATADPEDGNLLTPEQGNLLAEQAGNLLGEEAGNLLGEQYEVVSGADDAAVAVVRQVRGIIWP